MMILFDLDDTLYPEKQYIYQGFKEVAKYLNKKHGLDLYRSYYELLSIFKSGSKKVFDDFLSCQNTGETSAVLVDIYRRAPRKLSLYPDVTKGLNEIKKSNHKLILITNGRAESQRQKLEQLCLAYYFDEIFILDEYGQEFWKPSTLIFQSIYKKYGGEIKDYMLVGNAEEDFEFSKNLGIRFVYIQRRNQVRKLPIKSFFKDDNFYRIKTLDDIGEIIPISKK